MQRREDIRNIAIIAHVDHGKTTLVNQLLKQSDTLPEHMNLEDRAMDSNDIERERGITILSKNTAVKFGDTTINILDTPGHADFGGEVERIMHMVDGALLLVDAYEGTMPQTRFVLKKALEAGVKPIVVINKIDRPGARPSEVLDEVLELFIELGATDEQLDFPVVYASALNGTSSYDEDLSTQKETMDPVFETIVKNIPAPVDNVDEPLQFQITMLDWDDYVGRIGVGRVYRGKIKVGDQVTVMKRDGSTQNFRVTKLFGYFGLKRNEIQESEGGSHAGDEVKTESEHHETHNESLEDTTLGVREHEGEHVEHTCERRQREELIAGEHHGEEESDGDEENRHHKSGGVTDDESRGHADIETVSTLELAGDEIAGGLADGAQTLDKEHGDTGYELHDGTHLDAEAENIGDMVDDRAPAIAGEAADDYTHYHTEEKRLAQEAEPGPMTNSAVDNASHSFPSFARMVTEASPLSAGYPSAGSMICPYVFPSSPTKYRS